jgi:hypothetical protein
MYCLNLEHQVGGPKAHDRVARVELVTTGWELRDADSSPRLVTAYIDG